MLRPLPDDDTVGLSHSLLIGGLLTVTGVLFGGALLAAVLGAVDPAFFLGNLAITAGLVSVVAIGVSRSYADYAEPGLPEWALFGGLALLASGVLFSLVAAAYGLGALLSGGLRLLGPATVRLATGLGLLVAHRLWITIVRRRAARHVAPQRVLSAAQAGRRAGVIAQLMGLVERAGREAGPEVGGRVGQIRDALLQALPEGPQLDRHNPRVRLALLIATDFLPTALDAYLALPRTEADNRPLPDGRTARIVLRDQLDRLHDEAVRLAETAFRDDSQALLVHDRFLTEHLRSSRIGLPPARVRRQANRRQRP